VKKFACSAWFIGIRINIIHSTHLRERTVYILSPTTNFKHKLGHIYAASSCQPLHLY